MSKLSTQSANALQPGEVLKCHVVAGLWLRCNASGSKSWLFYHRVDGKQRKPRIGEYPSLSIEAARASAKRWHERVASGEDPSKVRQERRHAPTVAGAAVRFIEHQQLMGRKLYTIENNQRHINLYILPRMGFDRVDDVTKEDIDKMLRAIAVKAPAMANRVSDTLSGIFRVAGRTGDANPVKGTFNAPEHPRERYATKDESVAIARELERVRAQYQARVAAILVILLAGTRITEILTAKRSQRSNNVIVLEQHKTDRGGKKRRIYLPLQAADLLDALPDDGSGYIFGAELARVVNGRPMGRHDIGKTWAAVVAAAGCPDLQVRDLRRTFASAAKSSGVDIGSIGMLLGHSAAQTTEIYAHIFDDKARTVVQATADELAARMLPPPGE